MRATPDPGIKYVAPAVRWMTLMIAGLAVVIGPLLYLLPDRTDQLFAWTIKLPLTAVFLGGSYLTAMTIELLAAREHIWARARIVYPAMLLFTMLTLIATFLSLEEFHLDSPTFIARATAWAWLVVYLVAPLIMLALLVYQIRRPGTEPAPVAPLPDWFRSLLAAQAGCMLLVGAALFLALESARSIWPWQLGILPSRAIGAWLLGLGLALALAARENDWTRVQIAMISMVIFAALQLIALARFAESVQWGAASAWIYLLFLVGLGLSGLYGWRSSRHLPEP